MGLLADILLAPVTGPARGFVGVLEAIRDEANAHMPTVASLQDELISLNSRLELGELSEADFRAREAELIAQLKEMREAEAADQQGDDELREEEDEAP